MSLFNKAIGCAHTMLSTGGPDGIPHCATCGIPVSAIEDLENFKKAVQQKVRERADELEGRT